MYPIRWTCGLQHLSRVFDERKFRGYLVLAWSRPSMAIIKQLSVAPGTVDCSLSVASRHWSVRYAFTFDKWIFWAYSKAAFSFAEWACPIRALKCAHWEHLSLVKHTQVFLLWPIMVTSGTRIGTFKTKMELELSGPMNHENSIGAMKVIVRQKR